MKPIVPVGASTVTWLLRIAVPPARLEHFVPDLAGRVAEVRRAGRIDRLDGVAVHLHDPEHRLAVQREAVERADGGGLLGAGQVRRAVHDRRDRAARSRGPRRSRTAGRPP